MAILKIARMGHPILMTPAAVVPDPRAPEIRSLVNDMVETMIDANGAGLAAPPVHVPLRVVVVTASLPTLAKRIAARGRESAEEVEARLARSAAPDPIGPDVTVIANEGTLEEAIAAFLGVLRPATGSSPR